MKKNKFILSSGIIFLALFLVHCSVNSKLQRKENKSVPNAFNNVINDSANAANLKWNSYFTDPDLVALIDSALVRNQELNIMLQEIKIAKNEVRARKGEYLPFLGLGANAGLDKVARYTSQGANDANTDIMPGKEFPDPLPNFLGGVTASWELDIWKKLRNAKNSAVHRYLSSVEGKNFMVTNLIAEIANSYYELLALDNQLDILNKNIEIQLNALEIVKFEKNAARVTELAVKKFEAEVFKNKSHSYEIRQQIIETENKINFLVGRFPQHINRNSSSFIDTKYDSIHIGVPSQLLTNRPDIKKAEQELMASKLDIKVARAQFLPSLRITGGAGLQAFNPNYLLQTPQSLLFSIAGDMIAPLVNRNAIKANYYSANSKQIQAAFKYEQTILNAFTEVSNQVSNLTNLRTSYEFKTQQVQALNTSVEVANTLFKSARADYMEVLMTQRDALESKFELIETKKLQMHAIVNIYKSLGGGWK